MKKSVEYQTEDLLSILRKNFKADYEGIYALLSNERANLPLYNLYANPVITPSLAITSGMREGFKFEVHAKDNERIILDAPEDYYDLLVLLKNPEFKIRRIYLKNGRLSAFTDENLVFLKIQEKFPTDSEIKKAFNKKPTYIKSEKNEITVEKTKIKPITPSEQKQAISDITKKLKLKFTKTHSSTE